MKQLKVIFIAAALVLLSGCSMLSEVNDSIDYANTSISHIEKLNAFAEEAPQLIQDAMTDPAVKEELESQLVVLKQDIEQFISLNEVPSVAKSIHAELVSKNEALLGQINSVLVNGNLALDQLESSQLVTTINEVSQLMNRIENLAP